MVSGGTVRALESAEADQAAAALSGVDVEFAALGPSRSKHSVVELDLGPVCLRWARVGAPVCLIGQVQPGVMLLSTGAEGSPPWLLNGQPVGCNGVARLAPGASYAMAIERDSPWLALRLDAAWFQHHYAQDLPRSVEPVEILVSKSSIGILRDAFAQARAALHSGIAPNPLLRAQLRERVMSALVASLAGAVCTTPQQSRKAFALRYLHGMHRDSAFGVDELCRHLHLGERAVRRLFAELYGVSPGQYLRTRRLHQARRALRRVDGFGSVTEIALTLGFSDLGRFAAHYRSLFGELPSVTLRRRRSTPG